MYLPFSLSNPVSRRRWAYHNKPMDTLKVQMGLEQLGFMEPRADDIYVSTDSDRLFGAMEDFQKASDLEADGIANPDGPTHQAMNRALTASSAGEPAKPLIARPIPAADAAVRHKNERDIRVLGRRTDPGDFPVLMARTLLSKNGEAAAPEVADLLGQIYARNPDMGRKARAELAGVVDVTSMGRLDDAAGIPSEDRVPPAQPLLSDLQAVDEMRDGIPDLGDLEDRASEPSEEGTSAKTESEIEWKQEPTLFQEQGGTEVITYGPIRFELHTHTAGLDGFRYYVEWYPLDEEGTPQQVATSSDSTPERLGGHAILGRPKPDDSTPPYHNPHGWQVKINIPSQPQVHGNSAGNYLNIFTSDRKPDALM